MGQDKEVVITGEVAVSPVSLQSLPRRSPSVQFRPWPMGVLLDELAGPPHPASGPYFRRGRTVPARRRYPDRGHGGRCVPSRGLWSDLTLDLGLGLGFRRERGAEARLR